MTPGFRLKLCKMAAVLRTHQRRLDALGDEATASGLSELADDLYDAAWRAQAAAHRIGRAVNRARTTTDRVSVVSPPHRQGASHVGTYAERAGAN